MDCVVLCELKLNANFGIDVINLADSSGEHGILSKHLVGWDLASLLGSVAFPVYEVLSFTFSAL